VEFSVDIRGPGSGSFGRLTVTRGRALLESRRRRHVFADHVDPQIVVVRPRINLLDLRTVYVLEGASGTYGVRAGLRSTARLREALVEAGFELVELPTLFGAFPRPPFR
jgi:hypothetical protein